MMKVFERVIEQKTREMINIDAMQFGLMSAKGTMDAIFIARQLQKRYFQSKVYFAFADL